MEGGPFFSIFQNWKIHKNLLQGYHSWIPLKNSQQCYHRNTWSNTATTMEFKMTFNSLFCVCGYSYTDYTLIRNVIHQLTNQVFQNFSCVQGHWGKKTKQPGWPQLTQFITSQRLVFKDPVPHLHSEYSPHPPPQCHGPEQKLPSLTDPSHLDNPQPLNSGLSWWLRASFHKALLNAQ